MAQTLTGELAEFAENFQHFSATSAVSAVDVIRIDCLERFPEECSGVNHRVHRAHRENQSPWSLCAPWFIQTEVKNGLQVLQQVATESSPLG